MSSLTIRKPLSWVLAGTLLFSAAGVPLAEATDARDVLGVAHAKGRYNFTEGDYLNEGADRILELGSRVIKVFVNPGSMEILYPFNADWTPAPTDAAEVVRRPYFQALFAKPFTTILLVVSSASGTPQILDGLSSEEAEAERDQMYELAKYLLTTYADSGKTFILQNWEGDHILRAGLAESADPDTVRVQAMIDWWNARQDGVRLARQEVGEHGVQVYHAAEVNHLGRAMEGRVSATNDVVPFTRCDLYSYSSWDIGFTPQQLVKALDYLEAKAPDSRRLGRRNLYLGEYGMAKDHGASERTRPERIRQLLEAALGWGVRYAVYWQVYCNEANHVYRGRPKNKDLRGFWLVQPDGHRAPMWDSLEDQLRTSLYRAAFSSFASQYFSVAADRSLNADRWTRDGVWETFTVKDWDGGILQSGDTVTLQAHDGLYLSVESGAAGRVFARASAAGTAERFILRKNDSDGPLTAGDSITLESVRTGRFLGAGVNGRGAIHAVRADPGPAEVFRFVEPEE